MSCETGTRRVSLGGLKAGVSRVAGKTAYVAGVMAAGAQAAAGPVKNIAGKASEMAGKAAGAGKVAAAGAAGAAAGSLIAPGIGTLGGGLLAAGMMRKYLKRRAREKISAARETAWQSSPAGQKAVKQRDAALARLEQNYQARLTKTSIQAEKVKNQYEQARQKWLAEQMQKPEFEKQVKKAAMTSAAIGAAGQALENFAGLRRWGVRTSTTAAIAATAAGAGAARSWSQKREQVIEKLWKESAAGQQASLRYTAEMSRVKLARKRIRAEYEQKSQAVLSRYEQARTHFLSENFPGGMK